MVYALALSLLFQPPADQPFARHPDVFQQKVVYTCEGDLWLGDLKTHHADRLTRSEGTESLARFSPDGKQVAYVADYAGMREIYVISTEGGVPQRVTYLNQYPELLDWTPDGKSLIFRKNGYSSWRADEVYRIAVEGGVPTRLPLEFAQTVSPAPDGKRFAFNRYYRSMEPWFRYHGGLKNDVWVFDGNAGFKKIYQSAFTNEYPVWAGDRIAWVNDEGAKFSILSSDPDGKGLKKLVGASEYEIRNLQTDGLKLIYEKGRGLEVADLKTGKTEPAVFDMLSDKLHMLPYRVPANALVVTANAGPTGKRVLVETRGQIVSLPVGEGDVRVVLAKPGVRYQAPAFSPDAKKIAYISDETREQQLYVADADGSNPKQLTSDSGRQLKRVFWTPDGKYLALTDNLPSLRLIEVATGTEKSVAKGTGWEGPAPVFSPDSKWLAYDKYSEETGTSVIMLDEIATGKQVQIGDGKTNDWGAAFSPDGKWLAFSSRRIVAVIGDGVFNQLDGVDQFQLCLLPLQKDLKSPNLPGDEEEGAAKPDEPKTAGLPEMDLDDLVNRQTLLPVPARSYGGIAWAGDRLLMQSGSDLLYYDVKAKREGRVTSGVAGWSVSFDGKKVMSQDGANIRVFDAAADNLPADAGRLGYGGLQLTIDPVREWEQIYWDAWRVIRDYFYAKNMHGNDWKAIGDKYVKFVPSVRSRDELNILINWMFAELSVSHAGAGGGDTQGLFRGLRPSFLGVDLEPGENGFYKITKIFRGDGYRMDNRSPLAEPGLNVKEGMYLIDVAGVPARVGSNFQEALVGRAGQIVALKVNDKPAADGAKTIRIRPVEDDYRMRYLEWVKLNREYVDKASGGRLGYIHLPAMGADDVANFAMQYYTQRNKEGIVFDDRFNGGGNVSSLIINILKQKVVLWFNGRNNDYPTTRQGGSYLGVLACLINEFSGSNGEEFPHHFRALKLGPLVGTHTWGGEVGSSPGWRMIDNGTVSVPNYGAWEPDGGWVIEGPGLKPDYEVQSDPNLWVKGIDPQLDKAVQLLLDELKKKPRLNTKQPPELDKVKKPR